MNKHFCLFVNEEGLLGMAIKKTGIYALLAVFLCCVLTACSLAPDMRKPETSLPQNWQLSGPSAVRQDGPWWAAYNDEKLSALVTEALAYNSDIQLAAARVDEARAIAGSARASRMPNITAGGGASRSDLNLEGLPSGGASDNFILGGLLSFEVDLWGRLANADKAARQQLLRVPDVAKVELFGDQPEKIFVETSQKRLAQLGLEMNAVLAQLSTQNAVEAAGTAAMAFINTFVATAAAVLSWTFAEWMGKGKPSMLGAASGAVAGLVAVTPACGFVGPMGAIVIGLVSGVVCLWGVSGLTRMLGADDSLDVCGVHGVGGIVGALLTGVFASPALGGSGIFDYVANKASPDYSIGAQVWVQLQGVLVTVVWSAVVSFIAYKIVDMLVGLRVPEEEEREGLDIASHGESAYHH